MPAIDPDVEPTLDVLYTITRADVEALLDRPISNAECARLARALPHSSIPDALHAVLDACDIDLIDEEA